MGTFKDDDLQRVADLYGDDAILQAIKTHGIDAVMTECRQGTFRRLLHPFIATQKGLQKRCDQLESDLWCEAKRMMGKHDENVSAADCLLLAIYRIIALEVLINHQPPAENENVDG